MGIVNKIETMGLVDGPGIRVVVFLSGCQLRCLYCHNPEMFNGKNGTKMTSRQLVDKIKRYKNYFGKDGGVTFSGGEPLLQPNFLIETMKLCHEEGINTCLDTAGVGTKMDEEVLKYTDLVILDIKSTIPNQYKYITGKNMRKFEGFLDLCQKHNKRLWLRQVIVPGINDTKENIRSLKRYVKNIRNVEKIELLPYHTYGKEKYDELNLLYLLENVKPMNLDKLKELEEYLKK